MTTMRLSILLIAAFACAPASVHAQATGGAITIAIKGASDNRISLPYQKPPTDAGEISAVGASTLKLLGKQWTDDQFVYVPTTQPSTYYVRFASGDLTGVYYKVIGNNADTLVLETAGDNLTAHPLGTIAYGDSVKIVAYWTVADLFGATAAELIIDPRLSPILAKDDILLYDDQIGQNRPPAQTLYFRSGAGWRSVANPNASSADTVLPPGGVIVVRRRNPAALALVNYGLYYKQRNVLFVQGGNGTSGNDQQISLTLPEPITLNESNLAAGVVLPSLSPLLHNDELLFWRGAPAGFNVPANTTVFYLQGSGWRQVGQSTTVGDSFTIQPGEGLIIRKKAANASADWQQLSPP